MIELRNLTKKHGERVAVSNLDLVVNRGEIYALLGPNGAGKTTTMKVLAGLTAPTSGSALIDGIDAVNAGEEARRRLGYVPDTPYLHEKLTCLEHLELVAGLHRLPRAVFAERAAELLSAFDLEGRRGSLVEELSLGMRQRLAFAAAFLPAPRAVVIDEPWVGLDPRAVRTVIDFLQSQARAGVAMLMSTHSLAIAERMADRVGILDRGRLVAEGTVAEIRARSEEADLEAVFLAVTQEGVGE